MRRYLVLLLFGYLFTTAFSSATAKSPPWLLGKKGNTYTLDGKKIEALFKKSPEKQLEKTLISVVPISGNQIFIKIKELKPGNVFEPLGLRPGDTLKRLNGASVTLDLLVNKSKLPPEWENKKTYTLELDRQGKEMKFIYLVR